MRRLLALVVVLGATLLAVPNAIAAVPIWSDLDATEYAGPIGPGGTLIESVPLDSAISLPAAGAAYRTLYATTDAHNRPATSTAAVFLPAGQAPSGGWPVVAWAHGTVGLGDECTPSALPRSERDVEYLDHWLEQGYAIVASDYTGLGTPGLMPYLDTVATAHSIVDSVVASQRMSLPLSPKWAVIGQSQGGAGALGTARYATEFGAGSGLDYRGAIATGTPAFIEEIVATAGPDMALPPELGPFINAYSAYILAAFSDVRPDVGVDGVLTPAGRNASSLAKTLCTRQLADALVQYRPTQFFAAPLATLPDIESALADYMGIPTSGYDRPIFLGVGMKDVDVPPSSSLRLHDALRANGQASELHVYPEDDHSSTVLTSIRDSTPFLAQLMS